jgi:hypothetical protein
MSMSFWHITDLLTATIKHCELLVDHEHTSAHGKPSDETRQFCVSHDGGSSGEPQDTPIWDMTCLHHVLDASQRTVRHL